MDSILENVKFYEWLRKEKGIKRINVLEATELYWEEFKNSNKPTVYDKYCNFKK